ncbi:hypothetical protein BJ138DRAFT_1158795 [Hygrophoropsis aurantiaca]|uniref:Uncharacterized protein n=1 Tax=Hygrophoropsis aurantiaca TaxID=72124 RepID=A0ACB8A3J6_9AGAM|nr:hypothetical protein BJ138DRAFT_1158795 [Hygrophoropsis aurantiaca]
MPVQDAKAFPGTSRSNSLASSISSSGASLTRRSRTRAKTRTRTTTAGQSNEQPIDDEVLDISAAYSADAASASGHSSEPPNSPLPALSPISSQIPHEQRGKVSKEKHLQDIPVSPQYDDETHHDDRRGREVSSEKFPRANTTLSKSKVRTQPPSRITSPPSAFRPTPATEGDNVRSTVRDSLLTQQSSTSSSIYPASTNTESPPSPRSPIARDIEHPPSFLDLENPKIGHALDYDTEYRLRLLVKNNYFLPPAHSKPSPSDFAPFHNSAAPVISSKKPAFLDLFRVGKPKPSPPVSDKEPMLRVTSDSTTMSGQSPQAPSPRTFPFHGEPMAQVVVVREKMDDLVTAAKQAEFDIKAREAAREREPFPRQGKADLFDGIVDPTDAVDVPMPSSDYPLALQASAFHGMGIEDSVGAAALAERLPPPYSPGPSSIDPREDAWRKALLQAAVGHSLNNSLASLSFSASSPTPARSPRHPRSMDSLHHRALQQQQRRQLDQKIIANPVIDLPDSEEPYSPSPHPMTPPHHRPQLTVGCLAIPEEQRLSSLSYAPRAETPVPQTPLAPPPVRKYIGNASVQYSLSQTNLHDRTGEGSSNPHKVIRKTFSSPMLSDAYEQRSETRGVEMTPPHLSSAALRASHSPASSSLQDPHRMSTMTGLSRYTSEQDDEPAPRPSLAISLPTTDGRPTTSEYSQPSPTASAFQDRWGSEGYLSASSHPPLPRSRNTSREPPLERQSPPGPITRMSTMSPPPRPSSSLAGVALSPPPRRLPYQSSASSSRIPRPSPSRSSSDNTFRSFRSFNSSMMQRPPIPTPLMLNISVDTFASLHSAPPPASPAAFFDHIQGHPNAMDDLDDSDDEGSRSDGDGFGTDQDPTAVYAPSHQPPMMRLGNMSMPNVDPVMDDQGPFLSHGIPPERSKPIGNVPPRAPYFSSVKGSPDSIAHLKLAQYSKEHLLGESSSREQIRPQASQVWQESTPPPSRRPATAGAAENVLRWQMEVEKSSRQLDGMVAKHMEAERDTLKRIAGAAKASRP